MIADPAFFITTNGPGEVIGWVRPFLRALYDRKAQARVTVVVLPCAYATGRETELLRQMFPAARVIDPSSYGRFLLGRRIPGMERTHGIVQYLGGDLFHTKTIARRLGLQAMTYKFTRRSYSTMFERFFALDEDNAAEMRGLGAAPDRVRLVGNLVADSVVGSLTHPPPPPGTGDGVTILPGSRWYEVRFLMPFFMAVARDLMRLRPGLRITFAFSPFNTDEQLKEGIEWPGDPKHFGIAGRYDVQQQTIEADGFRFAVDRSTDYRALAASQMVISIPGTKCMEAAVLGRAMLVAVPLNRVEEIAMNGVAGYIQRVPLIGKPLKRWLARKASERITFFAQPNIDAGAEIVPEIRGVLHPRDVAERASAMLDNPHRLRLMGEKLAALYAPHIGASSRMVQDVVAFVERTRAQVAV